MNQIILVGIEDGHPLPLGSLSYSTRSCCIMMSRGRSIETITNARCFASGKQQKMGWLAVACEFLFFGVWLGVQRDHFVSFFMTLTITGEMRWFARLCCDERGGHAWSAWMDLIMVCISVSVSETSMHIALVWCGSKEYMHTAWE